MAGTPPLAGFGCAGVTVGPLTLSSFSVISFSVATALAAPLGPPLTLSSLSVISFSTARAAPLDTPGFSPPVLVEIVGIPATLSSDPEMQIVGASPGR